MIEMEDLKRGVKKYATPLYVYDLDFCLREKAMARRRR